MDTSASKLAISFALSGKWSEAISANLQIVKESPNDTDALCRLARAYLELGKISKAKEAVRKVLDIDPANQIAVKLFEKLKVAKAGDISPSLSTCTESFLEEPGKTKLITLLNPGDPDNFVNLDPGEEVKLATYPHRVSVVAKNGVYIGRLPDDIAARLKTLIKKGNKYQVLIKSVDAREITIFVREIEKSKDADGSPSFPPEKIEYVSFTPPELVHSDTPDVGTTEEENSEE
jgi:tetratricopeptide (TPR) repeat protein